MILSFSVREFFMVYGSKSTVVIFVLWVYYSSTILILGGEVLTSHKGLNFPTGTILASPFTEKDREDLLFGIQHGVDLVSLSYIKEAGDIEGVKQMSKRESADI